MAFQDVPGIMLGRAMSLPSGFPNIAATSIDATGEKLAQIFRIPKSGTLSKFGFYVDDVGGAPGSPNNFDVRLETISSGIPSGALYAAGANVSFDVLNSDNNSWMTATLDTPPSVTQGDLVAAVWDWQSYGDGGGFSFGIALVGDDRLGPSVLSKDTGAGYVNDTNYRSLAIGLEYDDGSHPYIQGIWPLTDAGSVSFANDTTNKLYGNVINVPVPIRVNGAWLWIDFDDDGEVLLIDSDGTTVLATAVMDENVDVLSSDAIYHVSFDADVELDANTDYYLAYAPQSTTTQKIGYTTSPSGWMDAMWGGINCHGAYSTTQSPTGTGDWTEETLNRYMIGLLVNGIDDGAGGGGGARGSLLRGLVG